MTRCALLYLDLCRREMEKGREKGREKGIERESERERGGKGGKEKGGNRVAFMCVPEVAKLYLRAGQRLLEFAKS